MRYPLVRLLVAGCLAVLAGCGGSTPAPTVTVSPSTSPNLDASESVSLTAGVTNDSSSAGVGWSVNCAVASCGTLSNATTSSVTYTAPATVTAAFTSTVVATSVANSSASASRIVNIAPLPTITGGSSLQLATGVPGTAYSYGLVSAGGTAPITWATTTGQLPPGLTLASTTGIISGTPTVAGTYSATVVATDSASPARTTSIALVIPVGPLLAISSAGPVVATQSAPYTSTFTATGGYGTLKWTVATGALPSGLTLSTTGVLSGTPTASGSFAFSVSVQDGSLPALSATASYTLIVNAAPVLTITSTTLPATYLTAAYSATLAAINGTGTLKWSLATGALPAGITLSTAGVLAGTPTAVGTFAFTVAVQDSSTPIKSASMSLSLVVAAAPPFSFTTAGALAGATVGAPYTLTFATASGTGSITYSLTSGSLPAGLNLATGVLPQLSGGGFGAGTLFGTPLAAGTFTFTVQATDSSTPTAQTVSQAFTLIVGPLVGSNNSQLSGHYAFSMSGFTDPDFCSPIPSPIADQPMSMAGSFVADGNGNITMGEYDSTVCGASLTQHTFTGIYAVGSDQRGKLVIATPVNGQAVFAFSLNQIQSGVAQQAQFIEFDDLTHDFNGNRGSGIMQLQTPSAFTQATILGNYVYGFTGASPAAGLLTFNGSGTVTGPSVTGTYTAPDATFGRMSVTINGAVYASYVVNAKQAFFASTGSSSPTSGQMRQQQSATYTNASLSGAVVGYGNYLYQLTADGAGNLTGTENPATSRTSLPFVTTYSVSSNGLALLGTGDVVWLYAPNAGYSVSTGYAGGKILNTYESAVGAPAALDPTAGPYSVGTVAPISGPVVLGAGTVLSATASTFDFSNDTPAYTPPVLGTSTVAGSSSLTCGIVACTSVIPLSSTRGVFLSGSNLGGNYPPVVITVFQK